MRWKRDPEGGEDAGQYELWHGDESIGVLQLPGILYALEHTAAPGSAWRATPFVGMMAWDLDNVCVLIPNEWDDWRLKGLALPPLRDGSVSIDFPSLPEFDVSLSDG